MRKSAVILSIALLGSAIGVVYVRHESRVHFVKLQDLQAERDRLNIEWGRLLLEQGAWAVHGRIEGVARRQLGMVMPAPERIVIVRVREK